MLANPATSTVTRVTAATSATTLSAASTARVGLIIHNDSTANLYVKFGSSASTTDFTYFVAPSGTLESLAGISYTGIVTGIWSAAAGAAQVTELS